MKLTKIAGVLLAVLVVTGSAAALPGAAETHANDNADDAQADDYANENATEAANESEDDTADDSAATQGPPADAGPDGERGPPTDLPAQVPDFVSEIHSLVDTHIAGDLDGTLGEQISDVTPDDSETDDADDGDSDADDSDAEEDTDSDDQTGQ
ncbi:hypothetical protein [Haloarcula litorea]|uniref:hypothetical protein n=1 Tax=Haloarcula litorea TaxID=3032579 RepID=UPI0023E7B0EF|nr:hypothetical protein [Halomicroarcula sp. GDY20]